MADSDKGIERNRRQFLKATGVTALTATVAGCQGSDSPQETTTDSSPGGDTTSSNTTTAESGDQSVVDVDGYPYGVNETRVDTAREIMEEAGYGPDNQYSLDWLGYQDPAFNQIANTLRPRLESAHIQMNISDAAFSSLLEQTRNGQHEAYTLGWAADYPSMRTFCQILYPPNTVGDRPDARIFWSEDANTADGLREFMIEQYERIENNPEDTEEAREIRRDAAVKMEEGMWESAALIPTTHSTSEFMWYDGVDYNPPGVMGDNHAKTTSTVAGLSDGGRFNAITATFNSLDPIAIGSTASAQKVIDIFDALTTMRDGTTEVEGLLVESHSVSEDYRTYTFELKEGVEFHNGDELTAADVEYSIRRLMLSPNSTNTQHPLTNLNIERETDSDGNIDPDSISVSAVDDYTLEITLEQPNSYTLELLANPAFSVIPEGIVDDVPGYDGEMSRDEWTNTLIGSGPFTFGSWQSGDGGEVVLDTYENYHNEAASYEGVHYAIISGSNATYNYFLNENADMTWNFPNAHYDASKVSVENTDDFGREFGTYGPLENGQTVNYSRVPWVNNYYIGFHLEKVPAPVRKAMAYVLNHEQMVQEVYKGRPIPAFHNMPPQVYPGGEEAYESHYRGSGN